MKDGQDRLPPNEEDHEMILKAFLTSLSVCIFLPIIVVRFQTHAEKPWPLTVASLPVVFTVDDNTVSFDYGTKPLKALENHDERLNSYNLFLSC